MIDLKLSQIYLNFPSRTTLFVIILHDQYHPKISHAYATKKDPYK